MAPAESGGPRRPVLECVLHRAGTAYVCVCACTCVCMHVCMCVRVHVCALSPSRATRDDDAALTEPLRALAHAAAVAGGNGVAR